MSKTIIIILLSSFYTFSQTSSFLPTPSGKFTIGTTEITLTDSTRKIKGQFQQIPIKIWYPAINNENKNYSLYLEKYTVEEIFDAYKDFSENDSFFFELKNYRTNSYKNIPSDTSEKFPLIIFSPGYYFGLDDFYTSFMENLASNGYIIASISHPYDQKITYVNNQKIELKKFRAIVAYSQWKIAAFFKTKKPDPENHKKVNRMLNNYLFSMKIFDSSLKRWVMDSKFTLFYFQNNSIINNIILNIDTTKIASFGQSFGGAVAGQICYEDNRIKAACNLDGFQFGNLHNNSMKKPMLVIHSENYYDWIVGNKYIYMNTNPLYFHVIKNSKHFIFSDCPLFPFDNEKIYNLTGTTYGTKPIEYINKIVLEFFDKHLKEIENLTNN